MQAAAVVEVRVRGRVGGGEMLATSISRSVLPFFLAYIAFAFLTIFVVGLLYCHAIMICQAGRDMDAVTRFNQAVAAAPQQDGKGRDLSLAFANRLPTTFFVGV